MSSKDLTEEDVNIVKTLCEYLFFDQYKDCASYIQFEKSFKIFLGRDISLEEAFKEICGPKRKYINFNRMLKAFLKYKTSTVSKDLTKFFDTILEALKKPGEFVGNELENSKKYTSGNGKNSDCITEIQVLGDDTDIMKGFKFQYDDALISRLYDKTNDADLEAKVDMLFGLLDEKNMDKSLKNMINFDNECLFRDAVTYIFGTFTDKIEFLGFKTVSGKVCIFGNPVGEPFIFGNYGEVFHYTKAHVLGGIVYLQPYFKENVRRNPFLKQPMDQITDDFINDDSLILDEVILNKMKDSKEMTTFITTQVVQDDQFYDESLKDKVQGDDLKDVISFEPRDYQLKGAKKLKNKELLGMQDIIGEDPVEEPEGEKGDSGILRGKKGKKKKKENQFYLGSNRKRVQTLNDNLKFDEEEEKNNQNRLHPIKDEWNGDSVKNINTTKILKNKKNYNKLLDKIQNDIKNDIKKDTGKEVNENNKQFFEDYLKEKQVEKEEKLELRSSKRKNKGNAKKIKKLNTKNLQGKSISVVPKEAKKPPAPKISPKVQTSLANRLKFDEDSKEPTPNTSSKPKRSTLIKGSYFEPTWEQPSAQRGSFFRDDDDYWGYGVTANKNRYFYTDKEIADEVKNDDKIDDEEDDLSALETFMDLMFNDDKNNKKKKDKKNKKSKKDVRKETPEKPKKKPEENWKKLKESMEKNQGIKILQTIGSVIKALNLLKREENNDATISKKEKLKLYKLLKENQNIVDFLSTPVEATSKKPSKVLEPLPSNSSIYNEEDIDKLSIEDLNRRIASIEKLFDKTSDMDQKQKLNDLYNIYKRKLNNLIEEEDLKAKTKIIVGKKINVKSFQQGEEQKRLKAIKSQNDYLKKIQQGGSQRDAEAEDEIAKEAQNKIQNRRLKGSRPNKTFKAKESFISAPSSDKVYKNQERPGKGEEFQDDLFPAEDSSLCPVNDDGDWVLPEDCIPEDIDGWDKFKWVRVKEIFKTDKFNVFENGIMPDDILQGSIGDCYFLSAVAALAQKTNLIEKLFEDKEKSNNNCYGVYLRVNGNWQLVLLDDYIPCTGRYTKKFAFSSANGKELWMVLLEKAWAKINGSYAKVGAGGLPHEVFDVITDAYSDRYAVTTRNRNRIWQSLKKGHESGFIMTCGTSGDVRNLDIEERGLVPGHAYTILGVYEITSKGKPVKIVKIRNPWGSGEWDGDWNDKDSNWTSALRKQVGLSPGDEDDGIFCMSYEDFIKYYVIYGMCQLHKDYDSAIYRIKKEEAQKPHLLKFNINKNGTHIYLQLYQKNPRIILSDGTYQKPVLAYLLLCNDKFEYIDSTCLNEMTLCLEETLDKGTYYLITDINYRYANSGIVHGYNVTSYSIDPVELVSWNDKVDPSTALKQAIKSYCEQSVDPFTDNQVTVYQTKKHSKYLPFIINYFKNETKQAKEVDFNIQKKGGKTFSFYCDDKAGEKDTSVTKIIKPNKDEIILVIPYTTSSLFSIEYTIENAQVEDEEEEEPYNPEDEDVFKEEAEAIDDRETIWQYMLEEKNGVYVAGLENNRKRTLKMRITLEGFEFVDKAHKKDTFIIFTIGPNEKKVWRMKIPTNAYGDFSFYFDFE